MNIAIITGASSGLGMEYAKTILEENDTLDEIWLIARRKERLERFAAEHKEKKIRTVSLDLSRMDSFSKLDELLRDKKPIIKVLINNAGVERTGRFEDMTQENILNMIDLNVKGTTMVNKICFPYMKRGSYEILTCSVSSFCPVPSQTVYSASKTYIKYMGRALQIEMKKKGINVLTLCPGNMNTEMNPQGMFSQSKMVDSLPFLDLKVLTKKSLRKARKGYAAYTPGLFYKLYEFGCKLLPISCMLGIVKKSYDE